MLWVQTKWRISVSLKRKDKSHTKISNFTIKTLNIHLRKSPVHVTFTREVVFNVMDCWESRKWPQNMITSRFYFFIFLWLVISQQLLKNSVRQYDVTKRSLQKTNSYIYIIFLNIRKSWGIKGNAQIFSINCNQWLINTSTQRMHKMCNTDKVIVTNSSLQVNRKPPVFSQNMLDIRFSGLNHVIL